MNYSQAGEQAAILAWAASVGSGSFLDLGAYDGERYSNTAALADLGWHGICVDAAPDAVEACARRYADRPDVEVVHAAFSLAGDGPVAIQWTPGRMYSGVVASERDDVTLERVLVPRLDLGWLVNRLDSLPAPLFCSIDLEDATDAALRWLLAHASPACVCVEANTPGARRAVRAQMGGWLEVDMGGNPYNLLFVRG